MKLVSKSAIAISVFACATIFSINWSEQGGISFAVQSAQARIGRPLTPMSGAGVARRQVRRSGYGYGLAGAAAVGTAAAIGTAAAVAASPYYGGYGSPGYYAGGPYYQTSGYWGGPQYSGPYAAYGSYPVQDYATRNGFTCQPGTMVKLDDGQMYRCQ